MLRILKFLSTIILLCGCVTFAEAGETVTFFGAVDAGTLRVEYQGMEEQVLLIGVDVPESAGGKKDRKQREAEARRTQQAVEFIQTLVFPGQKVTLEFDVEPRDRHNRLQAYVFLPDKTMLNYAIIREGYAAAVNKPPNTRYAGDFSWAERQARERKRR